MSIGENVRKALVAVVVEQVLHNLGKIEYEEIVMRLEDEYHCYITDVYEHPEYLKRILKDLYGNAYTSIISKIEQAFGEFTQQSPYKEFIISLH